MIAEAVRASYKEAEWADHLPGQFVRKVINDGYIERNMEGGAQRLKKELEKMEKETANLQRQLGNEQFLAKAPAAVVEKMRARVAELEILRGKTRGQLSELDV